MPPAPAGPGRAAAPRGGGSAPQVFWFAPLAFSPSALRRRARGGAVAAVAAAHIALPGVEHVADIDLARGIDAFAAAVLVGQVALVAAADLQPLGALARQPQVDAVVDFEIVGE